MRKYVRHLDPNGIRAAAGRGWGGRGGGGGGEGGRGGGEAIVKFSDVTILRNGGTYELKCIL